MGWAQNLEGVVKKAPSKPIVDGVIDAVWDVATKYNVEAHVHTNADETDPTLGESGTTFYKALWDEDGMFVLVVVNDDQWLVADPYNKNDNIELYFDTNYLLEDGLGGTDGTTGNRRIMVTPPKPDEDEKSGFQKTLDVRGGIVQWAFKVPNKAAYTAEFFVPWISIPDKDGILFDRTQILGFDVTIIDRDPGDVTRRRADWSNANLLGLGPNGDNYHNMDQAGRLTLEGATNVLIDNIYITPGVITTDNGILKPIVTFNPVNPSNPILVWSIVPGGTGRASINSTTGELKAILDGTIIVKAVSVDGGYAESDETIMNISGQIITMSDINIIKNGNFELGEVGMQNWSAGTAPLTRSVVDGWYTVLMAKGTNTTIYANMFGQSNLPIVDATTPYTLRFKAFASTSLVVPMLFEDRGNSNNKVLTTTSPYRDNGYGKWDVPITPLPTWYTFDVTFDSWKANSAYELNFQVGLLDGTLYLDSIQLYANADLKLSSKQLSNVSSMKVYPNPVGNASELTVSLSQAKGSVAIYNSIGQKMMEKVATSTTVKFNVASLRKGMYFVKLSDGTTQKFIR